MSTSTVNLNIRMEKNLKEELDKLCKELDLLHLPLSIFLLKLWYANKPYPLN